MFIKKRQNLILKNFSGLPFYFRPDALNEEKTKLETFLSEEPDFQTLSFARSVLLSGNMNCDVDEDFIKHHLESIKNIDEKARLLNLYKAYLMILKGGTIDKESLNELYHTISKDLLSDEERKNMGKYFRRKQVYIVHNEHDFFNIDTGADADKIDYFIKTYFDFLNNYIVDATTDEYIKSQILHFYFIYVHPYFDMNKRTSRTLAMWYLLNKKAYSYVIFNRGISYKKRQYCDSISISRKTRDLTYFIEFMLEVVREELEKQYVIKIATNKACTTLDNRDFHTLLDFLSMKGERNASNFAEFYNLHNSYKNPKEIYETRLVPLLDKGILDIEKKTTNDDTLQDKVLVLRPLEVDPKKIENLQL